MGSGLYTYGEPLVYWTSSRDHQLVLGVPTILADDLWGRLIDLAGSYGLPDLDQVFLWVDGHRKWRVRQLADANPDALAPFRMYACDMG